ncbi:hypothetical protein K474DRAFT_1714164 [Panus rudis PR-1116 ss-1]|nr:hypothetical protein K474DRAFT_1714164 [Panus rudis PR-1116 ss-1]
MAGSRRIINPASSRRTQPPEGNFGTSQHRGQHSQSQSHPGHNSQANRGRSSSPQPRRPEPQREPEPGPEQQSHPRDDLRGTQEPLQGTEFVEAIIEALDCIGTSDEKPEHKNTLEPIRNFGRFSPRALTPFLDFSTAFEVAMCPEDVIQSRISQGKEM